MQSISDNLAAVRRAVAEAARAAGRDPASVRLIGVSKTKPVAAVREAAAAGLTDFGENYLQEATAKIDDCRDLALTWHYIGAIQSNKTRPIAAYFDWVHTVDRARIARRLSDHTPEGRILNLCLQINVDRDPRKNGAAPGDAASLVEAMLGLPRIRVRGLMTILNPESPPAQGYGRLAELFHELALRAGPDWDTLSMGMSNDYGAAIRAGATHVRVGTAIFGARSATAHRE